MATEYKLSYTASEIDEKLGKIDENTTNISKLSEEIASTAIKPFPYYAVNKLNEYVTMYKVNLEELENMTLYSVQELARTRSTIFQLNIVCDDGTEQQIINITNRTDIVFITQNGTKITLQNYFTDSNHTIDISDKSTANNVVVKQNLISKWLSIKNKEEYTPTGDYHPATKKYVDDSIAKTITSPTIAEVGQILVVKAVNENGKPTEWECVDIKTILDTV